MSEMSGVLGERGKGGHTLALVLMGGELGDHGFLVTCMSGNQE